MKNNGTNMWRKFQENLKNKTLIYSQNVKRSFLKIKDIIFYPYFQARQRWKLHKLKSHDKAERINKFIYEKKAYYLNHPYYPEVRDYTVAMISTWLVIWFVVVGYKYGRYTILLGAAIAVTISLAQYYLEWWYKLRLKYHPKK